MDDRRWPSEWLRGVLELCVLAVLDREGASYGYVIAQRLEQAGLGAVKGGTLYPILARLEREGLVAATWAAGESGPGRKYVELTDTGRLELLTRAQSWRQFVAGTTRLLPGAVPDPTQTKGDAPCAPAT